ncbi:hypothetical protein DENSPDRAFT_547548 [Dentipellis sp. KUC8613]|nr:hypothetical protein DENSPDRAFT_547548 [Dentipellis sp. KUC8613]
MRLSLNLRLRRVVALGAPDKMQQRAQQTAGQPRTRSGARGGHATRYSSATYIVLYSIAPSNHLSTHLPPRLRFQKPRLYSHHPTDSLPGPKTAPAYSRTRSEARLALTHFASPRMRAAPKAKCPRRRYRRRRPRDGYGSSSAGTGHACAAAVQRCGNTRRR